jgi:DNA polymerase
MTRALVGLGFTEGLPDLDFETFSMAGNVWVPPNDKKPLGKWGTLPGVNVPSQRGLASVGVAAYATHPSTEVLSLAYDLTTDGSAPTLWVPDLPRPDDLIEYIQSGGRIEAHNSMFEWWIWNYVCVRRYGWPQLPQRQLRCSMGKARAFGLPGGLGPLSDVLDLPIKKDARGDALLKKFSQPQQPSKKDPRTRHTITQDATDGQALLDYNLTDIKAERGASQRIPDLSGVEAEYWHLDQEINQRGVHIDVPNIRNAIAIIEAVRAEYTAELATLTGGIKPSENAQLKKWVEDKAGIWMDSFDDDAVTDALTRLIEAREKLVADKNREWQLPDLHASDIARLSGAIRALQIRQACASASVNKVYAMINQVGPNDRLYNLFTYHGARTGRPVGSGPQPTNLPKAGPDQKLCKCCSRYCGQHHMACAWCGVPFPPTLKAKEWNARMAEQVINDLHRRDYKYLEHHYGPALETVSGCLRGLFTAAPGHTLVASDFNAIEAVVTAQLAGEEWRLEVFRTHGKIYEMSAAKITGTPFEEFMAHRGYDMTQPEWWKQDATGPHHPLRGKIGKFAELALGFGGWVNGMKAFGADKYLSDQEIKTAILGWRDASPAIVEFWGGQYRGLPWDRDVRPELYGLEGMAIAAILNEGHWYEHRDIAYKYWQNVLYCRLPSGRCIHYQRPRLGRTIYMGSTDAGREKQLPAWSLQFEGWNTNPKNGPMGWIDIETYGGRLTENVVQATARDYQRDAQLRLNAAGYPIVLHVYDENVAEVIDGWGSLEEFESIMKQNPSWAQGWPINASGGWMGQRYRKD